MCGGPAPTRIVGTYDVSPTCRIKGIILHPWGSVCAPTREDQVATSKKDASLASKQLGDKKSTKAQKSVAGSDLAQAKKAGGKK
jgi:hypothetical protein